MKNYIRTMSVSFIGTLILVSFQNCSDKFSFSNANNSEDSILSNGPLPVTIFTPPGGGGGGTTTTLKQLSPALAVRDISCLACHANIQANVITDFGNPDPWYMGDFASPTSFGQIHYTATTWQTMAQIAGQVIVPSNATLPVSYIQPQLQAGAAAPTAPISLMDYLTLTTVSNFGGSWYAYFGEPQPATTAFTNPVVPPAGMPSVVPNANIYIGAPTSAEILAIAGNSNPAPWVQVKGVTTSGLPGLTIVTGVNGTPYVTNNGPVQCSGLDVVINGTLLLNNADVSAEIGGCRLYVTGSVFIQGQITFLNSLAKADPSDNLQITSATSIIMGVGLNGEALNGDGSIDDKGDNPLSVRLINDVRQNLVLRSATTATASQAFAQSILAEGENIGAALLQDASVPGTATTALSAAKQPRTAINYQHLLLNAPLIHSRYMGKVTGVVVAESAMFSLGEFSFAFDPVFQSVAILPALNYDIVCSGLPCTPANP